jgi:hypothetical protein
MTNRYCPVCDKETEHTIDYECYVANNQAIITSYWVNCKECKNITVEETKEIKIK